MTFDGKTFEEEFDSGRLTVQYLRVKFAMQCIGTWATLAEVASLTRDPEASISARLRDLRKPRFGSYVVERRARGERSHGLFEYRLLPPVDTGQMAL